MDSYDPGTGRFLNRSAKPQQTNPYVPWSGDPAGMFVAPLSLLGLLLGKKKKRGKWELVAVILVLGLSLGMSLTACNSTKTTPTEEVKIVVTPKSEGTIEIAITETPILPTPTETPTEEPKMCVIVLNSSDNSPLDYYLNLFRITKDEINQAGTLENLFRNEAKENPALLLARVAIGESPNKEERIRIMWYTQINIILGFNNTETRNQLGVNIWDHYGMKSTLEREVLEENGNGVYQFQAIEFSFSVISPENLVSGNLKEMLYPDSSQIDEYVELLTYAEQIINVSEECIKTIKDPYLDQVKGYDGYLAYSYEHQYNNFNPNDPKHYWGQDSKLTNFSATNPDPMIYEELNVWHDYYPIDNVFFGLITCQTEKEVVNSWWTAYGEENYLSSLFHQNDSQNVSCP